MSDEQTAVPPDIPLWRCILIHRAVGTAGSAVLPISVLDRLLLNAADSAIHRAGGVGLPIYTEFGGTDCAIDISMLLKAVPRLEGAIPFP
jgi:hypothetical protein